MNLNVFRVHLNVFECIWMYIKYICGIFHCVYIIFQCIYKMFQCISMCLNVFLDIVIGISPSHSHCNIFAMHILHIFFSLYTMTPFPTCYTTTLLFFHSRWSIQTFIQSILTFHVYTSFHIPHSTFYVVTGCAEHSGAQVFISIFIFYSHIFHLFYFFTLRRFPQLKNIKWLNISIFLVTIMIFFHNKIYHFF
jgi:hypothetical protein